MNSFFTYYELVFKQRVLFSLVIINQHEDKKISGCPSINLVHASAIIQTAEYDKNTLELFFSKMASHTRTNRCSKKKETLIFAPICTAKLVFTSYVSKTKMGNTNFSHDFYHKGPYLAYHKHRAALGYKSQCTPAASLHTRILSLHT